MIRITIILLSLSSCSYINYGQLPELIKSSYFGVDLTVDQSFYDSQEYSFMKINLGKSVVAIMVLSQVEDDRYTWISESNERIITQNGRIIETYGLTHDARILNASNLNPVNEGNDSGVLLNLKSPSAIIQQHYSVKNIGQDNSYIHLTEDASLTLYLEMINTEVLKWTIENKYWLNKNNRVLRSEQHIHPKMPLIRLEFYYK
ncbi:YjbF family lipoprotein [Gammaproteobacteria bacterium]|nr:YjbF family lipoprotein [Gammaproteobacteria bacterium]